MSNYDDQKGTARWATPEEIKRAGLFKKKSDALYSGIEPSTKREMWVATHGCFVIGGAGSGKLTTWGAQNICKDSLPDESVIGSDLKGEVSCIAQDQIGQVIKQVIDFNPLRLHGRPSMRINPTSHLYMGSPTLVMDTQAFWESFLASSKNEKDEYFVEGFRRYGMGIVLALVEQYGVLELPHLYDAVRSLPGGGREWREVLWHMKSSRFPQAVAAAEEIEAGRQHSSGGYPGIVGEGSRSVNCLADETVRASLSGPFDFNIEDLFDADDPTLFNLMVPGELVGTLRPILRTIYASAILCKARRPHARKLRLFGDEAGQLLKQLGMLVDGYVIGRGLGINPLTIWQSWAQMKQASAHAEEIIPSSAGLKIFFGIRDYETAKRISDMLGIQTIEVDDPLTQGRAQVEQRKLMDAVLSGADPFSVAHEVNQKSKEARHMIKLRRPLLMPDEVLRLPDDRMIVIADGVTHPILAKRIPYWEQKWMAGRYHPNPYHPPLDSVEVQTWRGRRRRQVVTEPVPDHLSHLPQYQNGTWSYIKGYRP